MSKKEQSAVNNKTGRTEKSSYIFTNKAHSEKAIMSFVLGIISIVSIVLTIVFTFQRRGDALMQYGTVLLFCTLFSLIGLGLGVFSRMERDKYYLFSYLGMVSNFLALAGISLILYAGAYGL